MSEKKVKCGFAVTMDCVGQKDFDQVYKSIRIVKKVRRVGPTDEDFVIDEIEEVSETPIKSVLDAQADSVGIEAFMKPYVVQGLDLPKVEVSEKVQDFSQFPDSPDDIPAIGDAALKAFRDMDPALKGKAKTIEEFINNLTQKQLDEYFNSKFSKKAEEKKEVKENE